MSATVWSLSAVAGNDNTDLSRGGGIGDKVIFWSNGAAGQQYGIGIQSGRMVLFTGSAGAGAVAVKVGSSTGQASSSTAPGIVLVPSVGLLQFEQQGNVQSAISHNFLHTAGCAAKDVVVIDTANAGRVTSTTTANSPLVVGVATAAAAAGAAVDVALPGSVVQVNCTTAGAVAVGDILCTSATAGQAQTNNAPAAGAILGKALSAKAAGAAGSVWCLVGR